MEQKKPGPPGIMITAIVLLSIGWVMFTFESSWREHIIQRTDQNILGIKFKLELNFGFWQLCEKFHDVPGINIFGFQHPGWKGYERCRDSHEMYCRPDICGDLGDDCCAPPGEPRVCKLPGHTPKTGGVTTYRDCEKDHGKDAIYECCPDKQCDDYTSRIDAGRASSIIAIVLSAVYLAFIIVDCACKKVLVSWLGGLIAILSFVFAIITWSMTLSMWTEEFCNEPANKDKPDMHLGQSFHGTLYGSLLIGASALMHWIHRSFCDDRDESCNACCPCCTCCCPHCFVDDMERDMDVRTMEMETANEPSATNEPSKTDG